MILLENKIRQIVRQERIKLKNMNEGMTNKEIIAAIENVYANPTKDQKEVWAIYNRMEDDGLVNKVSGGKTSFSYLNNREKNAVASAIKAKMKREK